MSKDVKKITVPHQLPTLAMHAHKRGRCEFVLDKNSDVCLRLTFSKASGDTDVLLRIEVLEAVIKDLKEYAEAAKRASKRLQKLREGEQTVVEIACPRQACTATMPCRVRIGEPFTGLCICYTCHIRIEWEDGRPVASLVKEG